MPMRSCAKHSCSSVPPSSATSTSAASRAAGTAGASGAAVRLTDREREVLRLVARGETDAEIAAHLVLSTHTVHRHIANIRTKLGVPSRTAAAAWALRNELI